ncbi:hypothetical protein FrEUN1fDRAFT_3959 [Parafrankia sp. EUN1f]|nr:hypothetical protein FrEUN1fDRAFT_3959 [Parafrankia sp. EUN1f]
MDLIPAIDDDGRLGRCTCGEYARCEYWCPEDAEAWCGDGETTCSERFLWADLRWYPVDFFGSLGGGIHAPVSRKRLMVGSRSDPSARQDGAVVSVVAEPTAGQVLRRMLRSPVFLGYALACAALHVAALGVTPWLLIPVIPVQGFGMGFLLARTFREDASGRTQGERVGQDGWAGSATKCR